MSPVRLLARTLAFQADKAGSIPARGTDDIHIEESNKQMFR